MTADQHFSPIRRIGDLIMKSYMRIIALILALLIAAISFSGCASKPSDAPKPGEQTGENTDLNKTSVIRPAVGTGAQTIGDVEIAYVESMNAFSAALISAMGDDWTGVISPLSFAMMLELLANGAAPEEQTEILNALMLSLGMKPTNENSARLLASLKKAFKAVTGKDSEKVTEEGGKLSLMTAILVGNGDKFSSVFEGNAADYFNASVGNIDFHDSEAALKAINGWVNENTNGLIPTLFDEIPADTVMALVNALYFQADWENKFTLYRGFRLSDTSFHGLNGDVMTSVLASTANYRYAVIDGNQVVLVPYANSSCYMAVILPAEGAGANAALCSVLGRFDECKDAAVELMMPAVELSTKLDAMEIVGALGLPGLADGSLQFANIVDGGNVFLTQFVHAAALKVTEFGTEAAAATGVTGTKNAGPIVAEAEYSVICNRPYAMAIVDGNTGAILFASVVNDIPVA